MTQIQLRRDTTSNWTSINPVLAAGEIGVDLTNNKFKIGDGASNWNTLLYANEPYTLPAASTVTLGGVKVDGSTITVDTDGTIHGANTYTLPVATTEILGGVKPDGTTITITEDGTITAVGGGGSTGNYAVLDEDNIFTGANNFTVRPTYNETNTILDTGNVGNYAIQIASGSSPYVQSDPTFRNSLKTQADFIFSTTSARDEYGLGINNAKLISSNNRYMTNITVGNSNATSIQIQSTDTASITTRRGNTISDLLDSGNLSEYILAGTNVSVTPDDDGHLTIASTISGLSAATASNIPVGLELTWDGSTLTAGIGYAKGSDNTIFELVSNLTQSLTTVTQAQTDGVILGDSTGNIFNVYLCKDSSDVYSLKLTTSETNLTGYAYALIGQVDFSTTSVSPNIDCGTAYLTGKIATEKDLEAKQDVLVYDEVATENSPNMMTSGAIYSQLEGLKFKVVTSQEYSELTPDATTLYIITG